jgi:predicted ester cyclase
MSGIQESNKAIVVRFNKEFIEKGNQSVFDETIADDFVNGTPTPGIAPDRAGVAHFFNNVLRPAFPDIKVTIHDQVAEGDEVVTRKSYTATHQGPFLGVEPTGRSVEFSVIDILKLRDGKYVGHWACADMLGLLGQLKST